jgi:transformer-2 protein
VRWSISDPCGLLRRFFPFDSPRGAGGNAPRPEPSNTLGVFGLSLRTRERDLDDEFQRYGVVQSVTIVYDQKVS